VNQLRAQIASTFPDRKARDAMTIRQIAQALDFAENQDLTNLRRALGRKVEKRGGK
jgi:hypothetical protein